VPLVRFFRKRCSVESSIGSAIGYADVSDAASVSRRLRKKARAALAQRDEGQNRQDDDFFAVTRLNRA
jgi:hypothetical protein